MWCHLNFTRQLQMFHWIVSSYTKHNCILETTGAVTYPEPRVRNCRVTRYCITHEKESHVMFWLLPPKFLLHRAILRGHQERSCEESQAIVLSSEILALPTSQEALVTPLHPENPGGLALVSMLCRSPQETVVWPCLRNSQETVVFSYLCK